MHDAFTSLGKIFEGREANLGSNGVVNGLLHYQVVPGTSTGTSTSSGAADCGHTMYPEEGVLLDIRKKSDCTDSCHYSPGRHSGLILTSDHSVDWALLQETRDCKLSNSVIVPLRAGHGNGPFTTAGYPSGK